MNRPMDPLKDETPKKPRNFVFLLVALTVLMMFLLLGPTVMSTQKELEVPIHAYLAYISDATTSQNVEEVILERSPDGEGELIARLKDPGYGLKDEKDGVIRNYYRRIRVPIPPAYLDDPDGFEKLKQNIPPNNFHYRKQNLFVVQYILPMLPWLLILVIIYYMFMRQIRASAGPGGVLSFGKSRARFISADKVKTTFEDVAGIDEAKDEVKEVIEFLRDPQKFQRLGGRIPRGILLVGPPGTGKTLLAKAIAGEANVPFLSISGSDFVEMFVGVGASRVRDVFKTAKDNSPCIIFLDEIDAVGRRRGTGLGGGHDEREQTLNQILVEMDGFDTDKGVIVLAATNRPDVLDPALLRPGRFDRQIVIDLPDVKGREEILRVHIKGVKLLPNLDLKVLARQTPMFSGADLASLINEAAIIATMKKREAVTMEDLEEARDKVLWGRQKKSRVVIEEERHVAAYHEGGHALVACLLPDSDPVHKVTIIPRGRMGGATMSLPERDRHMLSKKYCLSQLAILFGGRSAEELVCPDISSGAQDDIRKATELARRMICEWGMSEKLGPISYLEEEEHLFLGREVARTRDHSEQVTTQIDQELRRLVDDAHLRARDLLTKNRDKLEAVAQGLLKYETLSGDEIRILAQGGTITESKDRELAEERARQDRVRIAETPSRSHSPEPWKGATGPLAGPQQA